MDGVEVFRLAGVTVTHAPAGAAEVVAGTPTYGTTPVTAVGDTGVEVGVWEMSTGAVRDVEADEVFLVLAGAATITVDVWEVTSPLRKLYIA
jgi:uncharacterized cupin superfamily protein